MEKQIKYLRIYYWILITFGAINALRVVFLNETMSNDFQNHIVLSLILSSVGFAMVLVPFVLFPYLAIRELDNYKEKKKLIINIILVFIFIFISFNLLGKMKSNIIVLVPIIMTVWQIYMIYKIKKETNNKATK